MMILQAFLKGDFDVSRQNEQVRRAARVADVPFWKIAATIGVSEPTLTRWMRFPLDEDKETRIMTAISKLSQEVS